MKIDDKLVEIAVKHLNTEIDSFNEQGRDSLDFHDLHIAAIHRALNAAFTAGYVACMTNIELE